MTMTIDSTSSPTGIGSRRAYELRLLMSDLLRAGRTAHATTRLERRELCARLVDQVRARLEHHAKFDQPGLEAIQTWLEALASTEPDDIDRMQELLYGIDALVRVHIWRETGLELEPPPAHQEVW
jgi:hypothetical protein